MEENYTLKIDPESRDITFDADGMMETVSGDDTTAQAVRLTLQTWLGEFALDRLVVGPMGPTTRRSWGRSRRT